MVTLIHSEEHLSRNHLILEMWKERGPVALPETTTSLLIEELVATFETNLHEYCWNVVPGKKSARHANDEPSSSVSSTTKWGVSRDVQEKT